MRERTEILGGEFTVEGKPGRTLVNARIPITPPGASDNDAPGSLK
jgi:signal transduction histidine kinase